ncbi:MAG TPA: YheC/YheD family protein [Limnochordales bacterium]
MPAVPVQVGIAPRLPPQHAVLSVTLARWLGLGTGSPAVVRLGKRQWPVVLHAVRSPGSRLWLPPAAAGALGLPAPVRLWARRVASEPAASGEPPGQSAAAGTGTAEEPATPATHGSAAEPGREAPAGEPPAAVVDLGPVVGVLAVQRHSTNRLFLRAARARGVLAYLFTPQDVVWEAEMVWGRWPAGALWVRRPLPWPHVVFDRAIGLPQADGLEGFWRALTARGTAVFNGELGDKWRMHTHLSTYPELRPHLPETRRLDSEETLRAMLERWGIVYVKPAGGYMGRGIVQVARFRRGWCRLTFAGRRAPRVVPEAALGAVLAPWIAGGACIVQQGVDLVRIGGAVCDVRVLVLKDGRGRWRVVGTTVRRGRPGMIASNLHQGGHPVPFRALARRVPRPPGALPLKAAIHRLVGRLLAAVDAAAPLAGDVGIDIGVDRAGRLWIIEINTKPGRSGKPTRPAVYGLPMDYARFLAGFG